ncbi:hypothetical protein C8R44DRAFT_894417 [Mycena epipterygia]|nr:hypothetical protein C8R44DRAFT_894417 [Mycena epipterygia]
MSDSEMREESSGTEPTMLKRGIGDTMAPKRQAVTGPERDVLDQVRGTGDTHMAAKRQAVAGPERDVLDQLHDYNAYYKETLVDLKRRERVKDAENQKLQTHLESMHNQMMEMGKHFQDSVDQHHHFKETLVSQNQALFGQLQDQARQFQQYGQETTTQQQQLFAELKLEREKKEAQEQKTREFERAAVQKSNEVAALQAKLANQASGQTPRARGRGKIMSQVELRNIGTRVPIIPFTPIPIPGPASVPDANMESGTPSVVGNIDMAQLAAKIAKHLPGAMIGRILRKTKEDKCGVDNAEDFVLKTPPSENEVRRCEEGLIRPHRDDFRFDFNLGYHQSRWNNIVLNKLVDAATVEGEHLVPVSREWMLGKLQGQLHRAQEAWVRPQVRANETPAEVQARANQYREDRAANTRLNSAKLRLKAGTRAPDLEAWKRILQMLKYLGNDGMSSEEEFEKDDRGTRLYVFKVKVYVWRAVERLPLAIYSLFLPLRQLNPGFQLTSVFAGDLLAICGRRVRSVARAPGAFICLARPPDGICQWRDNRVGPLFVLLTRFRFAFKLQDEVGPFCAPEDLADGHSALSLHALRANRHVTLVPPSSSLPGGDIVVIHIRGVHACPPCTARSPREPPPHCRPPCPPRPPCSPRSSRPRFPPYPLATSSSSTSAASAASANVLVLPARRALRANHHLALVPRVPLAPSLSSPLPSLPAGDIVVIHIRGVRSVRACSRPPCRARSPHEPPPRSRSLCPPRPPSPPCPPATSSSSTSAVSAVSAHVLVLLAGHALRANHHLALVPRVPLVPLVPLVPPSLPTCWRHRHHPHPRRPQRPRMCSFSLHGALSARATTSLASPVSPSSPSLPCPPATSSSSTSTASAVSAPVSSSSLRCAPSARTTTLSSLVRPSDPFPSLPTGDIAVIHSVRSVRSRSPPSALQLTSVYAGNLLVSARHPPSPLPFVHVVPPSAIRPPPSVVVGAPCPRPPATGFGGGPCS